MNLHIARQTAKQWRADSAGYFLNSTVAVPVTSRYASVSIIPGHGRSRSAGRASLPIA